MKNNFFEKMVFKGITWLMIVIMMFLTIVSLLFRSYIDVTYQEIIYYRKDNILLALVFLIMMLAVIRIGIKRKFFIKIKETPLLFLLLFFSILISGGWAFVSHSYPIADQASVLECVDGLMHGDYTCMTYKGYLQYNRHQVGLTAFYEIFFRIFTRGTVHYQAVYVLNTFMISGIFVILYLITKEITEKKEAVILELLLSFGMLQLMLYSTFVYGLIPGLFFALLGILFMFKFLRTNKWYFGILMALLLALSVVMKSNYLIFVIAVSGILAVKGISKKKPLVIALILLMFAGSMAINTTAQTVYENRTGMEFGDTIPNSAYIAMGMQDGKMAPGWFNGFNHVTYRNNGYDEEATDKIAKEYIGERLKEFADAPLECIKFYYEKIVSQWNEVTYECLWISTNGGNHTQELSPVVTNIYTGKLHTVLEAVMNLYQLLMFFGTLCMVWMMRKDGNVSKMILILCILGGFLFHILWEGKSQYIISYFPLFLPCAAIGFERLMRIREE